MLHRKARLIRGTIGLLTLVVCGPILVVGINLTKFTLATPPGVGDVEVAQSKITNGMSKDEVRSLLGTPHRDRGGEWDYWDSRFFVGSVLRVHFGDDDQVTSSEWWVD
jgi:hypothetical protein